MYRPFPLQRSKVLGIKKALPNRRAFAEAGGFEPPVQFPVRQFSKLVVSATHPHFQKQMLNRFCECKCS